LYTTGNMRFEQSLPPFAKGELKGDFNIILSLSQRESERGCFGNPGLSQLS
jgi:hypothetical protein